MHLIWYTHWCTFFLKTQINVCEYLPRLSKIIYFWGIMNVRNSGGELDSPRKSSLQIECIDSVNRRKGRGLILEM